MFTDPCFVWKALLFVFIMSATIAIALMAVDHQQRIIDECRQPVRTEQRQKAPTQDYRYEREA